MDANTEQAFESGKAFALGRAFAAGILFARQMAQDADKDEDVKYRTTDNGQVIAIKDGDVVGGAGSSVGPDNLPTLEFFASSEERKGQSFTKTVTQYARQYVKPLVESLRSVKGMPTDCERIAVTGRSINDLASKMNSSKAAVLPMIGDVYRNGTYTVAPETKNKDSFEANVYTKGTAKVGGKKYEVTVITKKRRANQDGDRYLQYGIGKADIVEDSARSVEYELVGLEIEKP